MAWTDPAGHVWAVGEVVSAADMNTYIRLNTEELGDVVQGDAGATLEHRHLAGALGSLPAAGNAGRLYLPEGQLYAEDGSDWRGIGPMAYDDFIRGDDTDLNAGDGCRSGHTWAEESGAWEIDTNALVCNTAGFASLDTLAVLDRAYMVWATVNTGGTVGNIAVSLLLKYVDDDNYIRVGITATKMQLVYNVGGGEVEVASSAIVPDATAQYNIFAWVMGAAVITHIGRGTTIRDVSGRNGNFLHANLAAATKIGFRINNTQDYALAIGGSF